MQSVAFGPVARFFLVLATGLLNTTIGQGACYKTMNFTDLYYLIVISNMKLKRNEQRILFPGIGECSRGSCFSLRCFHCFHINFQDISIVVVNYAFKQAMHGVDNKHMSLVPVRQLPKFRPSNTMEFKYLISLLNRRCIPPSLCIPS